jgi:uncharacterized RDD family membrane protein YckC
MGDFYRPDDGSSWRREVASRVDTYRARRGRAPRTPEPPSLPLEFEAPPATLETAAPAGERAYAPPEELPAPRHVPPRPRRERQRNIIEFPAAGRLFDELADPITDLTPRILEAEEAPPPPAPLADITLSSPPPPEPEPATPDFEVPLQTAPLGLRAAAAGLDLACVAAAALLFAIVAARLGVGLPESKLAAALAAFVAGLLWCGYQYLFLVYAGITPGKQALGLILATFEGEPLSRAQRRQRVLASMLSALSAGLGFLWAVVDEDALCWHDRITRTCVTTPEAVEPRPAAALYNAAP